MPFYKRIFYVFLEIVSFIIALFIVALLFFIVTSIPMYILGFEIQYYKITAIGSLIGSFIISIKSRTLSETVIEILNRLKGE